MVFAIKHTFIQPNYELSNWHSEVELAYSAFGYDEVDKCAGVVIANDMPVRAAFCCPLIAPESLP